MPGPEGPFRAERFKRRIAPQEDEAARLQRRLDALKDLPELRENTRFEFNGTEYRVKSIDLDTGRMIATRTSTRGRIKEFNLARIPKEKIRILKEDE